VAALAVKNAQGCDNSDGNQDRSNGRQAHTQEADALAVPLTSAVELDEVLEII
jgi:hypothetical protein